MLFLPYDALFDRYFPAIEPYVSIIGDRGSLKRKSNLPAGSTSRLSAAESTLAVFPNGRRADHRFL